MRRRVGTSLYAGLLFTVLAAVAWATGQPFVFPSLGPSAFALAFDRRAERERAARVVGSHFLGVVAGVAAWWLVADGAALIQTPPALSATGFRLVASATLSLVATSWAMIATGAVHPPACATTLIVSLGLLTTPIEVGAIAVSVVVLVGVHELVVRTFERLVGDTHPQYRGE
ncbi:HPP family protein [Halorubrum sp. SD626R]|uniref:HPP family protein n=1 Tax=Halorubrum TaxID=56688 RepID=UPI0010F94C9F|nr:MULTISPECIES: HPP family protein [Halorubrum]TKX78525.1 HPP family protein [Halorubrum sp. SD626R]